MEEKNKQRIVIDNKIRHGKPIIKGTRITVDEVLGALVGGYDIWRDWARIWNKKRRHSCCVRIYSLEELKNAVTIVELGRYRIRR